MQHPFIHQPRNGAQRIDQNATGRLGQIGRDVHFRQTQRGVADLGLLFRRLGKQGPHPAALIAGDHHHRAVIAADLLISAPFSSGHGSHVVSPSGFGAGLHGTRLASCLNAIIAG